MLKTVGRFLVQLAVYLLVIAFLEWLMPGFQKAPLITNIGALLILTLLNTFLRPVLVRLTLTVNVLTFRLFTLVLNGVVLLLVDLLLPRFAVGGLLDAIIITFVLSLVGVVLEGLLYSEKDQELREYNRIKRLVGKSSNEATDKRPGLILLEIDGLSEPVMRRAIEAGHMPRIANWIKSGKYELVGWRERPACPNIRDAGGHPARYPQRHPRFPLVRQEAQAPAGIGHAQGRRHHDQTGGGRQRHPARQ